jgi:hypothetical protein
MEIQRILHATIRNVKGTTSGLPWIPVAIAIFFVFDVPKLSIGNDGVRNAGVCY